MLKRHEIEILLKAGHSKAEAARLAGISLRSVNRIAAEAPVVHVDDAAEREKRRIGRPSLVEDFRKPVVKILEEKPDLPSLDRLVRSGGLGSSERDKTTDSFRRSASKSTTRRTINVDSVSSSLGRGS